MPLRHPVCCEACTATLLHATRLAVARVELPTLDGSGWDGSCDYGDTRAVGGVAGVVARCRFAAAAVGPRDLMSLVCCISAAAGGTMQQHPDQKTSIPMDSHDSPALPLLAAHPALRCSGTTRSFCRPSGNTTPARSLGEGRRGRNPPPCSLLGAQQHSWCHAASLCRAHSSTVLLSACL